MSESLIKMNGIIKFEKLDDIILDMKYIIDSSKECISSYKCCVSIS